MNTLPLAAQTPLLAFDPATALSAGVNAAFLKPHLQPAPTVRRCTFVVLPLDTPTVLQATEATVFDFQYDL